jgi:(p)ppGpp synthase/HD superfamily hydrolase
MAVKLGTYATRASVPAAALVRAYELAVARRLGELADVFHPDLLHPARTALILIEDVHCKDEAVLIAATLTESEFPALRVAQTDVLQFGERVAKLVNEIPVPDEALAEKLVTAAADVALIAVAERLDHARHLHFRDKRFWPAFFEQVRDIYLPVAARVNAQLHARLARWANAFEERQLSQL